MPVLNALEGLCNKGTALAGPQAAQNQQGFSPCFFEKQGEVSRAQLFFMHRVGF
jgi:hypothetical protein